MSEGQDLPSTSQPSSITVVTSDQEGSSSGRTAALWQKSLTKVVPAIVVIRVCSCTAFDGDSPGYSYATGFVVDKARGIILTNRHVVTPGKSGYRRSSVVLNLTVTEASASAEAILICQISFLCFSFSSTNTTTLGLHDDRLED